MTLDMIVNPCVFNGDKFMCRSCAASITQSLEKSAACMLLHQVECLHQTLMCVLVPPHKIILGGAGGVVQAIVMMPHVGENGPLGP